MKKYIKIYIDFFGYGEQDFKYCENCEAEAVDVHHIKFLSHNGKDEINNLIGLCRYCHNKAHSNKEFNESLKNVHFDFMNRVSFK